MEEFGTKLRILRQSRDVTLQELASDLGYESHSYLSEIESGKKKPTAELVLQVSRRFGVSTDSLLKDEVSIQDEAS
ncbi:helix-turn-helix domain-containing protein [Salinibacter ruber]|uniref:helix-turn-helix domain-containing protein n=1 Tax=Salinibacter ruber TaxID=146919 RepID=UPI003C6E7323